MPRTAVARALSLLLAACLPLPAGAAFDRLYVFGDSLSDVGNVQTITSGIGPLVPPTPGPYYFNGRFSNGPNFVETLSEGLGLGPVRPSVAGGDDYAYGGALATGTPLPAGLVVKDVDDQVAQYLAAHPVGSPSALYVVYAGSNDLITTPSSGSAAADSLASSIGRLYDAGARNVLAPNLPPLGLVPRNNGDPARAAAADAATAQFNAALAAALDRLEAEHPDLTLYRLDVAGLFADLVADPAAFGLTNVTDPAAPGLEPGAQSYDPSRIAPNPDQYLFWDDLHPSRAGQALLGRAALAAVPEPWSLAPIMLAAAGLLRRKCRRAPCRKGGRLCQRCTGAALPMKQTALITLVLPVALLLLRTEDCRAEDWPGFRGPTGLGYTREKNLPIVWGGPGRKNVVWEARLSGQGHASPIVWGDRVFVCTARWPPEVREREKAIPDHHVTCYGVTDGAVRWDVRVPPGPWLRTDFRSGPGGGYAAPTPATDGKLVYCAFGSSVLAALDLDGKIVWRRDITPHTFDVTLGSSPVLHGDAVILLCAMANPADSRVVAFDKGSGDVKWERKLAGMGFGHATPVIIPVNGKPQMLVLASAMKVTDDALRSLDPDDGRLLWWCRGAGDAASPACGSGLVYFDNGRGGPGFAVDPTGSGDVTATHTKWSINRIPEGIGSPVIVGAYVYRLHTPGVLRCMEVSSGREVYSERLDGISSTWASPIADPDGRLFFANAGRSYVVQGGPQFRVLAVNDLDDGNHPSPAAANGRLFLVGTEKLYCIGTRE